MNLPPEPAPRGEVKVERYKGERKLQKGIAKMQAAGWRVQSQTSRKSWWRFWTGPFTRRQVHTVTVRPMKDAIRTQCPASAAPFTLLALTLPGYEALLCERLDRMGPVARAELLLVAVRLHRCRRGSHLTLGFPTECSISLWTESTRKDQWKQHDDSSCESRRDQRLTRPDRARQGTNDCVGQWKAGQRDRPIEGTDTAEDLLRDEPILHRKPQNVLCSGGRLAGHCDHDRVPNMEHDTEPRHQHV
jgi:hypothetical protein